MSTRFTGSFMAALIALCTLTAAGFAGQLRLPTLDVWDGGGTARISGDLAAAGLPRAEEATVAWRDYDGDGDRDFVLLARDGSSWIARVFRNDGGGIFSAAGGCVTTVDTTVCEGNQSAGVKIPSGTSNLHLWVRNLTSDIAPGAGTLGIEATRSGGARLSITVIGGGHAIVTQGRGAHGIYASSAGNNGAKGADDYGGFNPFYPVSYGDPGQTGGKGGRVEITNDAAITTSGALAHGIFAYSQGGDGGHGGHAGAIAYAEGGDGGRGGQGGDVDVTNQGFITTHGDSAHGILAVGQGGNGGGGGDAGATVAQGGTGGGGGLGSLYVTVHNSGGITTEGIESHGILVQSLGGIGGHGGVGGGFYGEGGGANSSGSGWIAYVENSGTIRTSGVGSNGIFAQSIGGFGASGGGSGGAISFGGLGATGGNGGHAYIYNSGAVTTGGRDANALFVQSIGGGGGSGAGSGGVYSLGGSGSAGGNGDIAHIQNSGQLGTQGSFANGILAQSIGGGGGNGAGSGGLVSIGGGGSSTGHGGEATVQNTGAITTAGEQSHAIMVQSIGGGGGSGAGSGGMVSIGGSGDAGGNGGVVTVTNSGALATQGLDAAAILAQSVGGGGGNGGSSGGIASFGGRGSVTSDGGRVTVTNSGAITTGAGVDTSESGSQAIFAQSVGGGGGNGGSSGGWFSIGGAGGGGGDAGAVAVSNTGALHTRDNNSSAIFAQSVGGGGGNGGGSGSGGGTAFTVSIGGSGARGGTGDTVNVSTDGGAIWTEGDNSDGILAQSIGGGGGNGGFSVSGSWVTSPVKVAIGGNGGPGGSAGIVNVHSGSSIETNGADAHGITAQSIGGGGGNGGFAIAGSFGGGVNYNFAFGGTGGIGGNGGAVNAGSLSDPLHGSITTTGERSYGIMAQSIGGGGGNGGFAVSGSLLGLASVDLGFGGKGGTGGYGSAVSVVSNADIHTGGEIAHGILAQSIGGGGGAGGWSIAGGATAFGGATLSVGGAGGPGARGGTVDVANGGTIETEGGFSNGILAQSIGGGGGAGGMSGSVTLNFASAIPMPPEIPVTVSSNFAIGIGGSGGSGGTGDSVAVSNSGHIVTHGDQSQGIMAQSIGGGGGAGGETFAATVNVGLPTGPPSPEIKVDFALAIGGSGGSGNHAGAVEVANDGRIDTEGDGSHGILAQSIGGGGGTGGDARAMTVGLDPSEFLGMTNPLEISKEVNIAVGGSGGSSGNGGTVTVANGGDIVTRGADAYGIMAQSIGGGGGAGGSGFHGLDLSDLGVPDNLIPEFDSWGLDKLQNPKIVVGGTGGAGGSGAAVDISNAGSIATLGDGSFGILAQSIGAGGGIGGIGAVGSDGTVGVGGGGGAAGNGGTVDVRTDGSIETFGTAADAIVAQSVGGGGGIAGNVDRGTLGFGLNLAIGQNGGSAGDGGAVSVDVGGAIVTHGSGSNGIFAQSVGGGGGLAGDLGNGFGFAGSAGGNGSGGAVEVNLEGSITTYGDVSHGIVAQSAGGQNDALPGDRADRGSAVSVVVDGNVVAHGKDSHGIVAQSVGGDGGANVTVDITSGTVQGGTGSGVGVLLLDGADNLLTNHGSITTVAGIEGTAIQGTLGNETIDNYGTVTGSIDLGGGTNSFTNHEGAIFDAGSKVDLGANGVFTNAGTFSPGGAGGVATTTVGCDFIQTGTGVYEMTVSGSDLDQVIVEGGSATLDGKLRVVADHEAYQDGTTYDIIQTGTGQDISGSFSEVELPETAFLDFGVDYLNNSVRVSVDVAPFTVGAGDPVQQAIAEHLDSCLPTATGDMAHLLGMFQIAGADQVGEAFSSLSPETYDNLSRGALQSIQLHQDGLTQRMDAARTHPAIGLEVPAAPGYGQGNGLWLGGAHEGADQDASGGYLAHNFTTTGGWGGYERSLDQSVFGLAFGTLRGDVDRDNETANGKANSILGSIYGGHLWGRTFAQGVATYAHNSFENRRDVHVGSLERVALGDYSGNTLSALLTAGHRFEAGRWGLEPFTSLRYARLSQDAFTEKGAESANLILDSRTADWLGSDLGLRITTRFGGEHSAFLPELLLGWNHDFGLDNREIVAAFEGDPSMSFTMDGQDIARDGATIGAGLAYHTTSGWKASFRYDRVQRSDYRANSFMLRLGSGF